MHTSRFWVRSFAIFFASVSTWVWGAGTPPISDVDLQFFENEVRPILVEHCQECHSSLKGKVKGGLDMDNRESLLKGGEKGPVFKAGDPSGSSMIKAVEWLDDLQMPPKTKLSALQITTLKEWITRGAPDPRDGTAVSRLTKADHWAFQAVTRPAPPAVKNNAWCKNSIDKFILAKLEEKEMLPAEPPDTGTDEQRRTKKEALLRRAYFDLIGVPPKPEQIKEFVNNVSPNAFEQVVDTLLESPAYGERWARHWLDTARYSDTTGLVAANLRGKEYRYPYAYSYRDWVISAINADMPYDQFILNQLAADKIPQNPKKNLAALGFLTVGQRFKNDDDVLNDRIDVVGRGFLGLTLGCARCHDHKFDPIKQADYYALKGIFKSTSEPKDGPVIAGDPNSKEFQDFSRKLEALEKKAYSAFYQMQRESSEELRKKAAAYFEASYLSFKPADAETSKRAQSISSAQKLKDYLIVDVIHRRIDPRDPILGPFIQLVTTKENRDQALQENLFGKTGAARFNPIVLEFLRSAGPLPNQVDTVGALFEKMMREKVTPAAGTPANSVADPVKDLEHGGIYKIIANPKTIAGSPQQPLMELAVFPFPLVVGSEVSLSKMNGFQGKFGQRYSNELVKRSGMYQINEMKLTSGSGPVRAMVLEDLPTPIESPIYPRGNMPEKGSRPATVPRRFIEVLSEGHTPTPFKDGSGRYELAQAIASKTNPLTARVMVNRVWMYHFGEGLVRTPDDLGNQAGKPSHPELLDYLTSWFTEDYGETKPAWSLKALHKAIMLSSTYQQSSSSLLIQRQQQIDAGNTLLWHTNVRRLDFESFRDSLLSMAGILDPVMFGPPVNLVSEPYSFRRSIYGYIDRLDVPDLMTQFDMAAPLEPNTRRSTTIVPQQALFLMNSPFAIAIAKNVVRRSEVIKAVTNQKDARSGVIAVFQIVLQRTPSKPEFDLAMKFLQSTARKQAEEAAAIAPIAAAGQKEAEAQLKKDQNIANDDGKKAIVNHGDLVARVSLTPWEALVQALMFSNEASYLN
ncbi:MAG: PSD1 and planctomycete cytochrome C domain-containing protein [Verrucomicrobiota bacterium]